MQYNSFFPAAYGGNMYQTMPQQYQIPQNIPQTNVYQPQNTGGFVRVQSENQAREYPVAPGNSVTFINDVDPYCYTKTAGTSPLEAPIFKVYKLVEEHPQNGTQGQETTTEYAEKSDIEALSAAYTEIKSELERMKNEIENLKKNKSISKNFEVRKNDDLNLEYDGVD